jgi:endoglucanase
MSRLNCFLTIAFTSFSVQLFAQAPSKQIALNQVGFYTNAEKVIIVTNAPNAIKFYVLSVNQKDTFYRGSLGKPVQSLYSSTVTKSADFNNFNKAGEYILYVPTVGISYPFKINTNIFHEVAKASLKAFYFQRASMPLQEQYAGAWARNEGHPDTTVFIHPSAASLQRVANTVISSPGGWYDAGDYNKYIVNSGITMGTMLSAYEDFPAYFDTLQTNIPESADAVPDILNEVLYNLRWMFTMQDKNDGGVYHKCTNARFDAMIMPDAAMAKRYVVQKGTAASLDFAAVMAQASRIYKKFPQQLPGLADSCLAASKQAWQWALKNPAVEYNQAEMNKHFLPVVLTGDYGDKNFTDEFFWAACELLAATKDTAYLPIIQNELIKEMTLPSWNNVDLPGCYTLLRLQKQLPAAINGTIAILTKKIISLADNMLTNGGNKAFATIFGQSKKDFIWGSNAVAMNESILLINACLITNDKKYLLPAMSNVDYVLGRNATGYCFVTGFGSKPAMHPHHRPSVADNIVAPVPGLLVGGPNPGRQDKCFYANTETEAAYTDDDCAYACNEIAINWNAPLVYVSNVIEALQL